MKTKPPVLFRWRQPMWLRKLKEERVKEGRVVKVKKPSRKHSHKPSPSTTTHAGTITLSTHGKISSTHGMATRGTTKTAARNAVFNTQELLEEILSYLPIKDLFVAESVCAHWMATARTSGRLRRQMFVEGLRKRQLLWFDDVNNTVKMQDANDRIRFGSAWLARQTPVHTSLLNTTLFAPSPGTERQPLVDRCKMCETLTFLHPLNLSTAWNAHTTLNNLYIANPPPAAMELEVAFAQISAKTGKKLKAPFVGTYGKFPERYTVESWEGVTWGDVVRELDTVLYVKNAKKPKGARGLVVDAGRCRVWMKGIVFLSEEERGMFGGAGFVGKGAEGRMGGGGG